METKVTVHLPKETEKTFMQTFIIHQSVIQNFQISTAKIVENRFPYIVSTPPFFLWKIFKNAQN